jgi:hypothetical protein
MPTRVSVQTLLDSGDLGVPHMPEASHRRGSGVFLLDLAAL